MFLLARIHGVGVVMIFVWGCYELFLLAHAGFSGACYELNGNVMNYAGPPGMHLQVLPPDFGAMHLGENQWRGMQRLQGVLRCINEDQ